MTLEELQVYLPKYLSAESEKVLFDQLRVFGNGCFDHSMYTLKLTDSRHLYQGDGVGNRLVVRLPQLETKLAEALILSNTCDISLENERPYSASVLYSPIILVSKYQAVLQEKIPAEKIKSHLASLRSQRISSIFYLPAFGERKESLVFLDQVVSCPIKHFYEDNPVDQRLLTLSDSGAYLFLFKLSIHFTRMMDKVERGSVVA